MSPHFDRCRPRDGSDYFCDMTTGLTIIIYRNTSLFHLFCFNPLHHSIAYLTAERLIWHDHNDRRVEIQDWHFARLREVRNYADSESFGIALVSLLDSPEHFLLETLLR